MYNQYSSAHISPVKQTQSAAKLSPAMGSHNHNSVRALPTMNHDNARSASALALSESNYSSNYRQNLNSSVDLIKKDRSTLKNTGSSLIARMAGNKNRANSTLDYGKTSQSDLMIKSKTLRDNPYGSIEISDMFKREAKA